MGTRRRGIFALVGAVKPSRATAREGPGPGSHVEFQGPDAEHVAHGGEAGADDGEGALGHGPE